jgi:hypothetical protein
MQADSSGFSSASASATQADPSVVAKMQAVFYRLTQSLAVLNSAAELLTESDTPKPNLQTLRTWLQPNARQAEMAMHQLRSLRLTKTAAATELSQCLTVLVLAADMLINGQLSGDDMQETYDLLRRNSDRAMKSLVELREQIALAYQDQQST